MIDTELAEAFEHDEVQGVTGDTGRVLCCDLDPNQSIAPRTEAARAAPRGAPRPNDDEPAARRPTPLESLLNGSLPSTRRAKELLDAWATDTAVEVVALDKSYAYRYLGRAVTCVWPEHNAIDAHLDHLADSPSSKDVRKLLEKMTGKSTAPGVAKRQLATAAVVEHWDWLKESILEPKRRSITP